MLTLNNYALFIRWTSKRCQHFKIIYGQNLDKFICKNDEYIFYTDYVYSDFLFYIDRLEIILGGEGGCLDWFFVRLLTRDPPSEVCSMQM